MIRYGTSHFGARQRRLSDDAQTVGLWPFYQRYRDHHADDPSGSAAFQAVVGRSVADANDDWARWVKRL